MSRSPTPRAALAAAAVTAAGLLAATAITAITAPALAAQAVPHPIQTVAFSSPLPELAGPRPKPKPVPRVSRRSSSGTSGESRSYSWGVVSGGDSSDDGDTGWAPDGSAVVPGTGGRSVRQDSHDAKQFGQGVEDTAGRIGDRMKQGWDKTWSGIHGPRPAPEDPGQPLDPQLAIDAENTWEQG
jgi:hypothetical protein